MEGFSAGDRVAALIGEGGYAGYAVAPARGLIPVPEGLTPRLHGSEPWEHIREM